MLHSEVHGEANTFTSKSHEEQKIMRCTMFSWTCFEEHGLSFTRKPNSSSPGLMLMLARQFTNYRLHIPEITQNKQIVVPQGMKILIRFNEKSTWKNSSQGLPNRVMGWGEWEILLGEFFYPVVGSEDWIFTIQMFFKAKNNIL